METACYVTADTVGVKVIMKITFPSLQFNNYNQMNLKSSSDDGLCYQYNLEHDTVSFTSNKPTIKSETLAKLYTPEFAPKRRVNEDGYLVTTVIDRKTNKPVEIYVKKVFADDYSEEYDFYEKKNGKYKMVAERTFVIGDSDNSIMPGYMETNEKAREKYAGLGIRCHQIAIERMMQLGFNNVEITSFPDAYPFHYKCGFRVCDRLRSYFEDNGNPLPSYIPSVSMKLPSKTLKKWKQRAMSQPILLGLE